MGVARAADWSVISVAEALKLQLKLTNCAQSLETNPRYHVRRISFVVNILEDERDPDDVVKPLSTEDQELLNWQAPTEDLQNDLQVRESLISLSRRLLPYKNISHTSYSNVTDDDSRVQMRGPHPMSRYRHVSCRSAMLTKHFAADGDVQTLFLYDGTAGDRSCWRRRSHEYIKLLVLPEARSPYRAFWLVQWDVVDMRQVSSDGQGDPDRGLCSNPAVVEGKDINKKQFYGIAEVAGADGNGLNRQRGSDARTNPRTSIPANSKPQTSRQSSSDAEEARAPDTGKKGGLTTVPRRRPGFKKLTIEIRPPKFKRKLWFGTYEPEDVDRAEDAINYYMGSNLPYHYSDSPSLFAQHRLSIEYRELLPSCEQFRQVGEKRMRATAFFARQVKEVIQTVVGKKRGPQPRPRSTGKNVAKKEPTPEPVASCASDCAPAMNVANEEPTSEPVAPCASGVTSLPCASDCASAMNVANEEPTPEPVASCASGVTSLPCASDCASVMYGVLFERQAVRISRCGGKMRFRGRGYRVSVL